MSENSCFVVGWRADLEYKAAMYVGAGCFVYLSKYLNHAYIIIYCAAKIFDFIFINSKVLSAL